MTAPTRARVAAIVGERMTEKELLAAVLELCAWLRLRVYHTHDSRRSEPGFPDLVIVGTRVLYRELKTTTGRVTQVQANWLDALCAAGEDADTWRADEWANGRIRAELEAIAR